MNNLILRCDALRSVEETVRAVLSSISYSEIDLPLFENTSSICETLIQAKKTISEKRLYAIRKSLISNTEIEELAIGLFGTNSESADAEVIATLIETISALGIDGFKIKISHKLLTNELCEKSDFTNLLASISELCSIDETYALIDAIDLPSEQKQALTSLILTMRLLSLYGLDEYVELDFESSSSNDGISFIGLLGDKCMAHGGRDGDDLIAVMNLDALVSKYNSSYSLPSVSVVFAEADAEGIAYDLAYTLRINGCITELYILGGDYEACQSYCEKIGAGAMLRVFADSRLMIKDFAKDEITETTVPDFIGYYHDDECDCHEHHHHDDDCDCHEHHCDCEDCDE